MIIFIVFTPIILSAQYIGVKYLKDKGIYKYKIVDFDGNLALELPDNTIPFFSSFLAKQYDFESAGWTITAKERRLTKDKSFFITEENQSTLPLSTPDSTYLIDFEGNLIKSFKDKYRFLSQPRNGIFMGYRPIKGGYGSYMLTYLDESGKELFNGKEYSEATPFSEGYAIIRENHSNGDWKVIDKSGNEIINLTKSLSLEIESATPFICGYANISVRKSTQEIEEINTGIEEISDSLINHIDIPLKIEESESRIGNILYRVNIKGELQKLDWSTSILNDIYHRTYFEGKDYNSIANKTNNLTQSIVDSVFASGEKFYLVEIGNFEYQLINDSGRIQNFPERYEPIKCIRNYILGKRNNNYVIYYPEDKSAIFFKDESPITLNMALLLLRSEKSVEEFVIENSRIIKIDLTGIASLLTLEGKVLYDFNAPEKDRPKPSIISQLNVTHKCLDELDDEELISTSLEYIHIECPNINIYDVAKLRQAKTIMMSGVDTLQNVGFIGVLFHRNIEIIISGNIKLEDLKLVLLC